MRFLASIAFLIASALTIAQLYPTRVGLLGGMALRLSEPQYQTELKLDEAQKSSIGNVFKSLAAAQSSISKEIARAKPDQYAAIQRRQEQAEVDSAQKIVGVLTTSQRERLMELALRETGPFALRNPEVAKRIGLTNVQRTKLNAIAAKTMRAMDELHADLGAQLEAVPQGKSGDKRRQAIMKAFEPKLKKAESQADAQVLSLLSAAQKQAWQRALGAPLR